MQLKELRPQLYTTALKETVSFYTDMLGFTCLALNEEWGWAAVKRDAIELSISLPNDHTGFTQPQFTGSFYIITEDVDTLWEELKQKVSVCYPIETFDYGMREFAIYDNNGYLLQFGQDTCQ